MTVCATVTNLSMLYVRVPLSVIQANLGVGDGTGVDDAIIAPVPIIVPVIILVHIAVLTWSPMKQPTYERLVL